MIDPLRLAVIAVSLIAAVLSFVAMPALYRETRTEVLADSNALANLRRTGLSEGTFILLRWLPFPAGSLVFYSVATIVAVRRSRQTVALLTVLLLVSIGAVIPSSLYALGKTVPLVAWFDDLLHALSFECIFLLLFLFPDGRFVPRWSRWPALASPILVILPAALLHGSRVTGSMAYQASTVVVVAVLLIGGVLAQVHRYRHISDYSARQQIKWVTLGVAVAFVGTSAGLLAWIATAQLPERAIGELVISTMRGLFVLLIPLSFGIAIMRYRLWDIDIIINRTLVYGALTAILSGLFAALVGLFQRLFEAQTGSHSNLAYVFTTLIVAGSFTPIKNGVQTIVDRRYKPAPPAAATLAVADQAAMIHQPASAAPDGEVLSELASLRAELATRAESEHELRELIARLEQRVTQSQDHRRSDE